MKKLFMSKKFIAGALSVLCLGILAVCLSWGKDDKGAFIPDDPVQAGSPAGSWIENPPASGWTGDPSPSYQGSGNDLAGQEANQTPEPKEAPKTDEYPKVVEENTDEAVIDFTDPDPRKDPPPETSGLDAAHNDPGDPPGQTPGSPPDQKSDDPPAPPPNGGNSQGNNDPDKPVPGSTNDKGEVYDPVFGWVKPGNAEQQGIDSDGDPDKMVGNMK